MRYTCSPSSQSRAIIFAEADRRFCAVLANQLTASPAEPQHRALRTRPRRRGGAQCDRTLLLDGDKARAHAYRGSALRLAKRGLEALASYDEAIKLAPRNAEEVHFNRGNLLQDFERLEEAVSSDDAALALAPE